MLDVVPRYAEMAREFGELKPRELVVVASAILDAALAEVIAGRLQGPEHEIVEFLGADGDGRAPAGSFGARMQLARLLGLFGDQDLDVLRRLKALRNLMAHRINVGPDSEKVGAAVVSLWAAFEPLFDRVLTVVAALMDNDPRALTLYEGNPDWDTNKHLVDE